MFKVENVNDLRNKVSIIEEHVKDLVEKTLNIPLTKSIAGGADTIGGIDENPNFNLYKFKVDELELKHKQLEKVIEFKKKDINDVITSVGDLKKEIESFKNNIPSHSKGDDKNLPDKNDPTFVKKFDYDTLKQKVATIQTVLLDYVKTETLKKNVDDITDTTTKLAGNIIELEGKLKREIQLIEDDLETNFTKTEIFKKQVDDITDTTTKLAGNIIELEGKLKREIQLIEDDLETNFTKTEIFKKQVDDITDTTTKLAGNINEVERKLKREIQLIEADLEANFTKTEIFNKRADDITNTTTTLAGSIIEVERKLTNEITQIKKEKLPSDLVKKNDIKDVVKKNDIKDVVKKDDLKGYVELKKFTEFITDSSNKYALKDAFNKLTQKVNSHINSSNYVSKEELVEVQKEVKTLVTKLNILEQNMITHQVIIDKIKHNFGWK